MPHPAGHVCAARWPLAGGGCLSSGVLSGGCECTVTFPRHLDIVAYLSELKPDHRHSLHRFRSQETVERSVGMHRLDTLKRLHSSSEIFLIALPIVLNNALIKFQRD